MDGRGRNQLIGFGRHEREGINLDRITLFLDRPLVAPPDTGKCKRLALLAQRKPMPDRGHLAFGL